MLGEELKPAGMDYRCVCVCVCPGFFNGKSFGHLFHVAKLSYLLEAKRGLSGGYVSGTCSTTLAVLLWAWRPCELATKSPHGLDCHHL